MNKTDRPRTFKHRTAGRWANVKADDSDARAMRRRSRWTRFSREFRKEHPLCFDPFRSHVPSYEPTESTHHIIPLRERPDLQYDEGNCAALCWKCHNKIERMERRGKQTRGLFEKGPAHA